MDDRKKRPPIRCRETFFCPILFCPRIQNLAMLHRPRAAARGQREYLVGLVVADEPFLVRVEFPLAAQLDGDMPQDKSPSHGCFGLNGPGFPEGPCFQAIRVVVDKFFRGRVPHDWAAELHGDGGDRAEVRGALGHLHGSTGGPMLLHAFDEVRNRLAVGAGQLDPVVRAEADLEQRLAIRTCRSWPM